MVGYRFNTIGVSDGISMGTDGMSFSLQSRDLIADSIETVMSAQWCVAACSALLLAREGPCTHNPAPTKPPAHRHPQTSPLRPTTTSSQRTKHAHPPFTNPPPRCLKV